MSELEVLQQISTKLDTLPDLLKGIQTLIFIGGAIIGLQLVNLFAKAWGKNS